MLRPRGLPPTVGERDETNLTLLGRIPLLRRTACRGRRGEPVEALVLDMTTGKVRWRRDDFPWLPKVTRTVYHRGFVTFEASTLNDDGPGNAIHIVSATDGKLQLDYPFVPAMSHQLREGTYYRADCRRGPRGCGPARCPRSGRPGCRKRFGRVAVHGQRTTRYSTGDPSACFRLDSINVAALLAIFMVCSSSDSLTPSSLPSMVGLMPTFGACPINLFLLISNTLIVCFKF